MTNLNGKTAVITGSSRGIGLSIAKRFAQDGANIVITGKTEEKQERLPGTIFSARDEVLALGANAIAIKCDIRFEEEVVAMIAKTIEQFGGIDILVNNASAISLTPTEKTSMKRFDLMHHVNARGTFLCSKYAIEHLKKADNPHILNIAPPLNLNPKWFGPHLAYTMSKYGMSLCTLGMAEELKNIGIAVNSLWPETGIATAAVKNLLGGEDALKQCRTPEIVADAAHAIVTRNSKEASGNFFIDSEVLSTTGQANFDQYAVAPGAKLMRDFFLD